MKFTDAPIRSAGRSLGKLGLHHGKNGLVFEPAVVIGTVAVQADEGNHRDAGCRRFFACRQQFGAVIGARVGHDGTHAIALHTGQHVGHRVRSRLAVPGFLVVVQVGVE